MTIQTSATWGVGKTCLIILAMFGLACVCGQAATQEEVAAVTHREGPLATITKKLYLPYPKPGQLYWIRQGYVGPTGLDRYQVRTVERLNDVLDDAFVRYSKDNGRTWNDWQREPDRCISVTNGYAREPYVFSPAWYDPSSKRMVRMTLMRTHKGDPRVGGIKSSSQYWDHSLYQTSADGGHTWGQLRLLTSRELEHDYMDVQYSEATWTNEAVLAKNRSYTGYNIEVLKDGGIALACSLAVNVKKPVQFPETVFGVRLFVGHWNAEKADYDWTLSNPVGVLKSVSDRGLMEPWVAQLRNGDILVDMRGTSTSNNPGRNFCAVSKDGGKTLSEAIELKFDDGSQFYAPSSMSSMFRHSVTKKLYWFGNISDKPTSGNAPRYPLYMAEVDESGPALKRSSLTIIDDYDPNTQTWKVQLSNFVILEDRETHAFDMYMTLVGENTDVFSANVYRYVITLK